MAEVTLKIDAQTAKALQKLTAVATAEAKIGDAAKKAGRDSDGAKKQQVSSSGDLLKSVASLAAGWASVSGAINLAKREVADYMARQREAANTALNWSQARARALEMRPGDAAAIDAMVSGAARQAQMPETEMWRATPAALSAAKGLTLDQVGSALATSGAYARVQGGTAEDIATRAQYTQDVMRLTGATDAKSAWGSLGSVVASARGVTAEGIARAFVPAVKGYQRYGDTYKESMGFVAGMSYLMGDVSGEQTATGYAGMREKLSTLAVPGYGQLTAESTVGKLHELEPLWKKLSPAERRKLLPKISRGAIYQGKVRALIEGDEDAWRTINESTAGVVAPGPEAAALVDTYFGEALTGQGAAVGEATAAHGAALESIQLRHADSTITNYDALWKGLGAAGVGWNRRNYLKAEYGIMRAVGVTPENAARGVLDMARDTPGGISQDDLRSLRTALESAASAAAVLERRSADAPPITPAQVE